MSFHPNNVARRAQLATIGLVVGFCLLLGAFFRTQVLQNAQYVLQSETNRLREVPLPAPRGIIYDRDGRVIAENVPGYSVSVLAPTADSLRAMLHRLGETIPLSNEQLELAVRRYRRAPNRPTAVLSDASFDIVSVLEEHRVEFPGLIIQSAPKRHYPDGAAVASFVGYTGEITESELESRTYRGYKAGQQVGKGGLEREYEDSLRGREGTRFVEVDARGRVVRDAGARADIPAVAADPLYTSIDLDLQRFTAALFGDSLRGGAIALDPNTGEVLALHSAPAYDPNRFIGGIPADYWRMLNTDPRRPLYNKVIQARYPPGSTWKLATATYALENGIATLDDHMPVACTGGFQFGNRYFHCWDPHGHGDINLARAIEVSCDVYFYQLGLKIGIERLVAGGVSLGFRDRTGIDLPNESTPLFPYSEDYYNKRFGPRGWNQSVVLNLAIGQGENAQTVASMARFYTALATDGEEARPTIARRPQPTRTRIFQLTAAQMAGIRRALIGVVSSTGGTARGEQIQGVVVAGKTGSAQNPDDPTKTHSWFVGFAPADHPKIVVAVMLEFGGHGGHAARLAAAIIAHFLKVVPASMPGERGLMQRKVIADFPLVALALLLSVFGILMVYSAGQTDVPTVVARLWRSQVIWLAISLLAALLVTRASVRFLEWVAWPSYLVTLIVLASLFVLGSGAGDAASSHSWLTIGGRRIGQPSEVAKITVVLMLARVLASSREAPKILIELWKPVALVAVPIVLILGAGDLGSCIVFVGLLFAMLFWAGVPALTLVLLASPIVSLVGASSTWVWGAWFFLLVVLVWRYRPYLVEGIGIILANVFMGIIAPIIWERKLKPYQRQRLLVFLDPSSDPRASGYHVIQSQVAIGSGGWLGKGFTMGTQKRLAFLPAQHTDFIFSVVGEELGFIGVAVALTLFLVLFMRAIRIATRANDTFSSLVAFGLAASWVVHVGENVGMTLNLMPITGIPLPFFSYGGSFMLSSWVAVGILVRISGEGRGRADTLAI